MKEYFTGHRDATQINEFLNGYSGDSRGGSASIVQQAHAQGHDTASMVQAPAYLENQMEASAGV